MLKTSIMKTRICQAFDKFFKGAKDVSITIKIISNIINGVIRAILNFFIQKFYHHKKVKNFYKWTKIKNAPKNT